jgi:hypothetical protein
VHRSDPIQFAARTLPKVESLVDRTIIWLAVPRLKLTLDTRPDGDGLAHPLLDARLASALLLNLAPKLVNSLYASHRSKQLLAVTKLRGTA